MRKRALSDMIQTKFLAEKLEVTQGMDTLHSI